MPHVAAAARLARAACLDAHAGERWNCTSIELAPRFTPDLLTGDYYLFFSCRLVTADQNRLVTNPVPSGIVPSTAITNLELHFHCACTNVHT
ncbi:jg24521 [Pararge aegeria aegeria]|uniref:Jg24521 protein n=1 Tax=Pararge aegeria aegeria TaxID=348720 RepID=A0A8S4R234_9NEOP|nr:jg24521 [Pararge aegeria aegeria]